MTNPKKFSWDWDYQADALKIVVEFLDGSKAVFGVTKENLEDMSAAKFVKFLNGMVAIHQDAEIYKSQYLDEPPLYKKPSHKKLEQMAELCLPRIRQLWHLSTGGSAIHMHYSVQSQTFDIQMSQGFVLQLPRKLFEDEKYSHIEKIIDWLASHWQSLKHISGYDFSVGKDEYYELGFLWPAIVPTVKDLHVYDLGDGMLVPCQLAQEIVQWIGLGKKKPSKNWFMSQEMIEDDMYGSPSQAAIAAIADKVDKAILYHQLEMYPGKIFLIDDMVDALQYLTDPNAFAALDIEKEEFDFLPPKNMQVPMSFYGKGVAEMLSEKVVKIPKKPKQITKESLEYFHKILGGKKDLFIKG